MPKRVVLYAQPGWLFCKKTKEFLSHNAIAFEERDISEDPAALNDLESMGLMTTPAAVIDGQTVVGFDEPKLRRLLGL